MSNINDRYYYDDDDRNATIKYHAKHHYSQTNIGLSHFLSFGHVQMPNSLSLVMTDTPLIENLTSTAKNGSY